MLSLFVCGCNDDFKETCEIGVGNFVACTLCEVGRQQAMGGRGCGKYSMERRSKMLHDAIRRGAQGQKKGGMLFFC